MLVVPDRAVGVRMRDAGAGEDQGVDLQSLVVGSGWALLYSVLPARGETLT